MTTYKVHSAASGDVATVTPSPGEAAAIQATYEAQCAADKAAVDVLPKVKLGSSNVPLTPSLRAAVRSGVLEAIVLGDSSFSLTYEGAQYTMQLQTARAILREGATA